MLCEAAAGWFGALNQQQQQENEEEEEKASSSQRNSGFQWLYFRKLFRATRENPLSNKSYDQRQWIIKFVVYFMCAAL